MMDSDNLNAARMSAAGDGLTEPLLDFIESLIRPDSITRDSSESRVSFYFSCLFFFSTSLSRRVFLRMME